MYCATKEEHQQDVAEEIEEPDAQWLAAVEELISEYENDHNMTSSVTAYGALGALAELKSKMKAG